LPASKQTPPYHIKPAPAAPRSKSNPTPGRPSGKIEYVRCSVGDLLHADRVGSFPMR
jgi:hypothetical protein